MCALRMNACTSYVRAHVKNCLPLSFLLPTRYNFIFLQVAHSYESHFLRIKEVALNYIKLQMSSDKNFVLVKCNTE